MMYIARDIDSGLVGNTFLQLELGRKKKKIVETGGNRKTSRTPR